MENENLNNQGMNGELGTEVTSEVNSQQNGDVVETENNEVDTQGQQSTAEVTEAVKQFTQSEVDKIITSRLQRVYNRYGVNGTKELDELVGRAQSYDVIKGAYGDLQVENAKLVRELAFLKNNINPERESDIDAYFKGKGLDFNNDNLVNELATHQEWLKLPPKQTTTIEIGSFRNEKKPHVESSEEKMKRIFGI